MSTTYDPAQHPRSLSTGRFIDAGDPLLASMSELGSEPEGGEFYATRPLRPDAPWDERLAVAELMGEERYFALVDLERDREELKAATEDFAYLECDSIGQLALELHPDAQTVVVSLDSEGIVRVTDVLDAEGEGIYGGDAPDFYSEDLRDLPIPELAQDRRSIGPLYLGADEDEWVFDARQAAKRFLALAPGPDSSKADRDIWYGRVEKARTRMQDAQRSVTLDKLHAIIAGACADEDEALGLTGCVQGVVIDVSEPIEYDKDYAGDDRVSDSYVRAVFDSSGHAVPVPDLDWHEGWYDHGVLPGRGELLALGISPTGPTNVTLDQVRRARGVADDPNQPSLFDNLE